MVKKKILVVDDEPKIRRFVRANLLASGYDVYVAQNGADALEMTERNLPDLIILDINLPDIDGIEICKSIRSWLDVPIIMLSVRSDESDKVRALGEGADDYVCKPFGIQELIARIEANLRRYIDSENNSPLFFFGDLEVNLAKRLVKKKGHLVKLTPTEYKVLEFLISNCGKVVSHVELLHKIWGPSYEGETEYVRVFIGQLRRKIEDDPVAPTLIITVPHIGYRLVKPDSSCVLPNSKIFGFAE